MSSPYRLLAVDIDRTLLNSHHQLPERNRAALHRAHEAGVAVCLCTGRCVNETREVIDAIGLDLDAGVFVFGALVSDLREMTTLCRTTIPAATAERLVGHFRGRGHPVLLLYDASMAGFDYLLLPGNRNTEAYDEWIAASPARVERGVTWESGRDGPIRIGIIDDPDHREETVGALQEEFSRGEIKFNPLYVPNYGLHVVECFAPTVHKWWGIMQLARRLGIKGCDVAAVGDDVNDVEMISRAGLGVAVANAVDSVKAVARMVVPSNDDCGVAFLVDQMLTGGLGSWG